MATTFTPYGTPAAPSTPAGATTFTPYGAPPAPKKKGPEQPKNVRPSSLRQANDVLDLDLAYLNAIGPQGGESMHPEQLLGPLGAIAGAFFRPEVRKRVGQVTQDLRQGGPSRVAENDVPFRKGWALRIIDDPNASQRQKDMAHAVLEHPYMAGTLNAAQEVFNPENYLAGGIVGKGLGLLAKESPLVARMLYGIDQSTLAVTQPVKAALGKAVPAVLRKLPVVGTTLGGLVDRYMAAGLPQRGGTPYVTAALAGEGSREHRIAKAVNAIRPAYQDLTTAEKNAVMRASGVDAQGQPLHPIPPEMEAAYAARGVKGKSLEQRAQMVRHDLQQGDINLQKYRVRLEERGQLHNTNTYFPMHGKSQPHFVSELDVPEEEGEIEAGGRGSRYRQAGKSYAHQTSNPIESPEAFADLHPDFDAALEHEELIKEREGQIANAITADALNELPSIDQKTAAQRIWDSPGFGEIPVTARMPVFYSLVNDNNILKFGVGAAGRKSLDQYITRRARVLAKDLARNTNAAQAISQETGVPISELGTRNVRIVRPGAANARVREAKASVKDVAVKGASPLARVVRAARATAEKSGKATQRMGDALAENLSLAHNARLEAHAAKTSIPYYQEDLDALEQVAGTAAAQTPTGRDIMALARDIHAERSRSYNDVVQFMPGGKVQPDWIWDGKAWKPAGEWANIVKYSKRYVDLSSKPKFPPAEPGAGIISRTYGNADDIADQAGMSEQEFREWLERNPKPPTLRQSLEDAREQITDTLRRPANTAEQNAVLEKLGHSGKSVEQAIADVRKTVATLQSNAEKYAREHTLRQGAERLLGPPARATVAAGERAVKATQEIADKTERAINDLSAKTGQRLAEAKTNLERLNIRTQAATRFRALVREFQQGAEAQLSQQLKQVGKAIHIAPGMTREASRGYGQRYEFIKNPRTGEMEAAPEEMALDNAFVRFRDSLAKTSPLQVKELDLVTRGFEFVNRLARAGIVVLPVVHAINNLGMHFLSEGGTPKEMADILTGRFVPEAGYAEEAYESGAATEKSARYFGLGDQHATTDFGERVDRLAGKAGPLKNVVKPFAAASIYSGNVYERMNQWLFNTVEQHYAIALYTRFRKAGMEAGDAALRVRQAMGRFENISPFESWAHLNQVFYFLPWMKTVIPFWIKKGLLQPQWWSAPVSAIRTNNEIQGFDDPSNPFTITAGRRGGGAEWRRYPVLIPQRVLGMVADLARSIPDVLSGNVPNALADLRSSTSYLRGHLNVFTQALADLGDAVAASKSVAGFKSLSPWNTFAPDSGQQSPTLLSIAKHVGANLFAPAEHIQRAVDDIKDFPNDWRALLTVPIDILQTPSYGRPSAAEKQVEAAVHTYVQTVTHGILAGSKGSPGLNAMLKTAEDNGDEAAIAKINAAKQKLADYRAALYQKALPIAQHKRFGTPIPPDAVVPTPSPSPSRGFTPYGSPP